MPADMPSLPCSVAYVCWLACSDTPGEKWYARVLAFMPYTKQGRGQPSEAAFVQWYAAADYDTSTEVLQGVMPRLKWARRAVPAADGKGEVMADWFDLVPMSSIAQPVLIQRDPNTLGCGPSRQRFFHNPFVS